MERKKAKLTDMSGQKCEKKGKNIVFPRKVRNYTKVWILVFLAHCELQCRFGSNPELYFLVFWFRLDIAGGSSRSTVFEQKLVFFLIVDLLRIREGKAAFDDVFPSQ